MKLLKEYIRLLIEQELDKKPRIIFMAGSPGAGKSSVRNLLNLGSFEVVDPDEFYEKELIHTGMGLNVAAMEEEYFSVLDRIKAAIEAGDTETAQELEPERLRLKNLASRRAKAFTGAQAAAKTKQETLAERGSNIIIDGTGGDFNRINTLKKNFEKMGYEAGMIFVYIPLEISQERNRARGIAGGRTLRDRTVEKSWNAVQANLERYRELFGDRFFYIDASDMQRSVNEVKPKLNAFI
jgi:predicted ABC-type ATPase